uniref:HAD family hydrolase n=1 Tax=Acetatifactor sp. TaxID=1872090 RepID=UPI004055BB9C
MVYSFDVFDTLITRKTATPQGVFAYMQRVLKGDKKHAGIRPYIRDNFYQLRIGAEQAARAYLCSEEVEDVTLEQIYEVMGRTCCLSVEEGILLAELERETEIVLVVGIDKNIAYLRELYKREEKILLISDMYLDSQTVRKMLMKVDSIFEKIPLYVSSDCKKNKVTGKLYSYVMEKEQITVEEWVHIGDHPYSDNRVPEKMGISLNPVKQKKLLPCESAALKNREEDVFFQMTIGASVNARLCSKQESLAYAYGTSLGGNIAFSYVYWLLQRSLEKGVKRLYFIARDGYLLKEIADSIISQNGYGIRTFYLYGSRKSWRMPAFSKEHFDIALMIRWGSREQLCRLDKLAELFEITREELQDFLPVGYAKKKERLEMYQLEDLAVKLENNEAFKEFILQKQKSKRELLLEYVKQQIDVSDEHFAFVELIGSGYTQRSLSYLLEEICDYPVRTFFYHMDAKMDSDQCKYYCYLPSDMQGGGLMELFYTAPHGHTIGYRKTADDVVEPVLDNEQEALLAYGLEDYQQGVLDFLQEFAKATDYVKDCLSDVGLSLCYRKYMAVENDEELLSYIGDMPYKYSGREQEAVKYAPKLDAESVRLFMVQNGYRKAYNRYKGYNFEFSRKRITEEEKDYWRRIYGFPVDRLKKRLVLYGAGKFGQALYKELIFNKEHQIVQWVDKNYEQLASQNEYLTSVDMLRAVEYDQIIIAILNLEVANEVKQELITGGIKEDKIVTYELALD